MSDQVTGHESGAKVGTAPVHPHDQMVGGVAGGVAKQTRMAGREAKASRTTTHNDRGALGC